ncbi:MAG: hypothetical protein RLZZ196_195 [Bacteroidota bacterium]|jgi:hypothetical protein
MSEELKPKPGELRGLALRPDPKGILIASYEEPGSGLKWGYTIVDINVTPAVYTEDGWLEFVHESVWNDIKANWDAIKAEVRDNMLLYPEYRKYPELNF